MATLPKCSRCSLPAVVYMVDSPRCSTCFTHYLRKTFKASLGRLGGGGRRKLAIAFSGGPTSAAVCFLYAHYVSTLVPNPKAPKVQLVILHVSAAEPPPVVRAVAKLVPNAILRVIPPAFDANKVRDKNDRVYMQQMAVYRALLEAAGEHECEALVLGTSATRAAADVLKALAFGRGSAVKDLSSGVLEMSGVKVLRPVRDIPVRLLVRYAYLQLPDACFVNKEENGAGIHSLTHRFIQHAGADNAASVHNIVRTADKLIQTKGRACLLCGSVIDKRERKVAKSAQSCGECQGCDCSQSFELCSACSACVGRASGDQNAVLEVISDLEVKQRRRVAREDMRKQIEGFLLDDDI
ncbi:Cytoplasmic tRNA 2-thiolation protein [Gracilaria domingensis]|nr:Cytoplasmic tRNA 2-thiolation protein [Gracilaria domingensis]